MALICHLLYCHFHVQRVGFLPPRDSQEEVVWVTLEESQMLPDIDWQILTFTPPPEQDNKQYRKNKKIFVLVVSTQESSEFDLIYVVFPRFCQMVWKDAVSFVHSPFCFTYTNGTTYTAVQYKVITNYTLKIISKLNHHLSDIVNKKWVL